MRTNIQIAIEKLLLMKATALIEADTVQLSGLLDPAFVYVNSHGKKSNKSSYLSSVSAGFMRFKSQRFENLEVTDFGEFAVATMTVHDEFEYSGAPYSGVFYSMCTFKRNVEGWLWAAGQTFELATPT